MFRSPADKVFLKRLTLIIVMAEIVVIGACFFLFPSSFWVAGAIFFGVGTFCFIVGWSVMFSPDHNVFSPLPEFVSRNLPLRRDSGFLTYVPHQDPRARAARRREAAARNERDDNAAAWFKDSLREQPRLREPVSRRGAHLIWAFGPLVAVILLVALLVWGGLESPS